jgi:HAD superfamily hydrolase (TIGR01509 family)
VTGAVLFDLDGTLADTEPLSQAAWAAVIARHGYEATPADLAALPGKSFGQAYAVFAGRVELPSEDAIFREHSAHLFPAIDSALEVFADAIEVVHALAERGVPLALVSASRRTRVQRTLRAAGIAKCFGVLVCGGEPAHPKPAPDGYLLAAVALGVDPRRCVVVEDTASGVEAGLAAGARVIALERTGPIDAQAHARAPHLTLELTLAELARAEGGAPAA